jgi:hypothetical protein
LLLIKGPQVPERVPADTFDPAPRDLGVDARRKTTRKASLTASSRSGETIDSASDIGGEGGEGGGDWGRVEEEEVAVDGGKLELRWPLWEGLPERYRLIGATSTPSSATLNRCIASLRRGSTTMQGSINEVVN